MILFRDIRRLRKWNLLFRQFYGRWSQRNEEIADILNGFGGWPKLKRINWIFLKVRNKSNVGTVRIVQVVFLVRHDDIKSCQPPGYCLGFNEGWNWRGNAFERAWRSLRNWRRQKHDRMRRREACGWSGYSHKWDVTTRRQVQPISWTGLGITAKWLRRNSRFLSVRKNQPRKVLFSL